MPLDFDELLQEATPESLRAAMMARLAEKGLDVDTREGSYTDLLYAEAAYQIWRGLAYHPTLLAAAVPSQESGPYLDRFGEMYGLPRTQATTAFVRLTFTGDDGVTIPAGTVAVSTGGLRFATDLDVTISGGTAEVTATAEAPGEQYNVAAGTVTRLTSNSAGIDSVTNEEPGRAAPTPRATPPTTSASTPSCPSRWLRAISTITSSGPGRCPVWAMRRCSPCGTATAP